MNDQGKSIETVPEDIYRLLEEGSSDLSTEALDHLMANIRSHIEQALNPENQREGTLRGSQIGEKCDRKTWLRVNKAEKAESYAGRELFKFLSGHIFEDLVLFLAEQAGHTVERTQEEVEIEGVKGHIDAVVDGVLTDVKTTTVYGLGKFQNNGLIGDDLFGYIDQIEFYDTALPDNTNKNKYAFLGVSRERGDILVDVYERKTPDESTVKEVVRKQGVVSSDVVPPRAYQSEADGAKGNRKLATPCAYCNFKHECWKDSNNGAGLRGFKFANGVRWYTRVVNPPNVPEVDRDGKETSKD